MYMLRPGNSLRDRNNASTQLSAAIKTMKLIAIKEHLHENEDFVNDHDCKETIHMSIEFYKKVGFEPPWIGYYASNRGKLVGAAGFKGKPKNGKVEVAYGIFPQWRQQGFGAKICRKLVILALKTDPSVTVLARTLPEENYSTKILRKNNFEFLGTVMDDEDGAVWEWKYKKMKNER